MKRSKNKIQRRISGGMQTVKPPRLLKDVSREPYGRRALIAAAAEIFSDRGYEAASLHDICAMAGTNIALVKYHFGSKAGLYEAVAETVYEANLSGFLDIAKGVHDAASWQNAIREWIVKVIDLTGNPEAPRNFVARIVAREFAEPSPLHEKVAKRFYLPLREEFAKLIRMAVSIDGMPLDDLQVRLWNASLGAICFSHAAVRPSWYEIYAPAGVARSEWAAAEADRMCQFVFSCLRYNG